MLKMYFAVLQIQLKYGIILNAKYISKKYLNTLVCIACTLLSMYYKSCNGLARLTAIVSSPYACENIIFDDESIIDWLIKFPDLSKNSLICLKIP